MLGEFISRGLLMILAYAYPALECFKIMEKNKSNIDELRFWCQYWIIIAILSVGERFGDVFISWVPFYGELKLAFIIYLWYPKTMGTSYVYDNLLRPFMVRHETDVERNLNELRYRAWDLALYYWENCTELSQSAVFNVFECLANQSSRLKGGLSQKDSGQRRRSSPPLPEPSTALHNRRSSPESNRGRPPLAQLAPSAPLQPDTFPSLFRDTAQAPKSKDSKEAQTEYVYVEDLFQQDSSPTKEKSKLGLGLLKFRRSKPT